MSELIERLLAELHSSIKSADDADKQRIEAAMQALTVGTSQHPEWYDFGCECDLCCSYGEQ
jgi:hypothetical protein